MRKKLVSGETLEAFKNHFENMQKYQNTAEGEKLFLATLTAVSEQIENLHVKAAVGNFVIENDGPKDLGGSGVIPGPMPMLIASIANCLEMTALLYLSLSNLEVNSIKVDVKATYDKRAALNPKKEPFPGFFNIKYTWYIDTDENLKKVDHILQKVEEVCPVKGTLYRNHKFPRQVHLVKESL